MGKSVLLLAVFTCVKQAAANLKVQRQNCAGTEAIKSRDTENKASKAKSSELNSVVNTLKNNGISEDCAEVLEKTFSGIPKDIMLDVLQKGQNHKSRTAYSEELKAFAMTLHFSSAKAYDSVREAFDLALPHPRQLRSW
ncbi:THAP domain containing 9 [Plakobranchus ocellatus]|uniref:THAP domain containing 9 n=1 Tax=Plakobranchus ocellatus TaxID=259542 RepID=A0AAV4CD81_9GAST|nr:THAP domain containing 9 [Plakobranchus ocellatus]